MKVAVVYKQKSPVISKMKAILAKAGCSVQLLDRYKLKGRIRADLVIAAGGDGTILSIVPHVDHAPVLGLNVHPRESVGFFCAATIDNFEKIISRIIRRKMKFRKLPLLDLKIDGKEVGQKALNEFLLSTRNAAGTLRYVIKYKGRSEKQKSSGIWVAAGPGSTAAIRSAGGKMMPIESQRIQFVVREPCYACSKRFKINSGFVKRGKKFITVSNSSDGMIFVDGKASGFKWKYGSRAEIKISDDHFKLYI